MPLLRKARAKKLHNNIQATVAIKVQELHDKEARLVQELKSVRASEKAQLVQAHRLCLDILALSPNVDSSSSEASLPKVSIIQPTFDVN